MRIWPRRWLPADLTRERALEPVHQRAGIANVRGGAEYVEVRPLQNDCDARCVEPFGVRAVEIPDGAVGTDLHTDTTERAEEGRGGVIELRLRIGRRGQ